MKDSEITVRISEKGVIQVQIHADDAQEKQAAHRLLAGVQLELDALDQALKSADKLRRQARILEKQCQELLAE